MVSKSLKKYLKLNSCIYYACNPDIAPSQPHQTFLIWRVGEQDDAAIQDKKPWGHMIATSVGTTRQSYWCMHAPKSPHFLGGRSL